MKRPALQNKQVTNYSPGRTFTNGFLGPKSSRDFRETGPRARKVLPKSSQGIAETSLGVEETLEGVWERSLCTRF